MPEQNKPGGPSEVGRRKQDNTETERVYTCLLYIGSEDVTGGPTLFADSIAYSSDNKQQGEFQQLRCARC